MNELVFAFTVLGTVVIILSIIVLPYCVQGSGIKRRTG